LEKIQWGEVLRNKRDRKHSHAGSRLDRGDKQKSLEKPRVEGGQPTGAHSCPCLFPPTDKEAKPHLDQAFSLGHVSTSKVQIDQRPPTEERGGWGAGEQGWQED